MINDDEKFMIVLISIVTIVILGALTIGLYSRSLLDKDNKSICVYSLSSLDKDNKSICTISIKELNSTQVLNNTDDPNYLQQYQNAKILQSAAGYKILP